jgi:hypothetical protein
LLVLSQELLEVKNALSSGITILLFTTAEKDALYSIMNREDLNWRKLNLQTAVEVNQRLMLVVQ